SVEMDHLASPSHPPEHPSDADRSADAQQHAADDRELAIGDVLAVLRGVLRGPRLPHHQGGHRPTRAVLVDTTSRFIISAGSTFFFRRTFPVATSSTSTTWARLRATTSLPDSVATIRARPS